MNSRQETALLGQEGDLPEADDRTERVNGHLKLRFPLDSHEHRLAFAGKIRALRGDVQGVEKMLHLVL